MKLRNVKPFFAVDDEPNRHRINTVLTGQGTLSFAFGRTSTNVSHTLLCEFGATVLFAMRYPMLPHGISAVISISTKKEMIRVNTRANIAVMTHTEAGWNGPIGDKPRNAVGEKHASLSATKAELTVALNPLVCLPFPTFIRLADVNFRPKSKQILRSQRRDTTVCSSHDRLLIRRSWSERLAA